MKVPLPDILHGYGCAAVGRASARVDVDGLVCVFYIGEESAVAEHMHRSLIVEEDPVWV